MSNPNALELVEPFRNRITNMKIIFICYFIYDALMGFYIILFIYRIILYKSALYIIISHDTEKQKKEQIFRLMANKIN